MSLVSPVFHTSVIKLLVGSASCWLDQGIITYPLCFLTAYKMTSRPSVLAGTSDKKTQTYTTGTMLDIWTGNAQKKQ